MLISTKGRYALRVMLELAQRPADSYTPLPVIAERQSVSEKYLESIVVLLSRAGLVEGVRGKGGGYRLTRSIDQYSVGDGGIAGSRHVSGGGGKHLPPCRSVPHPAHVGEAGQPHQRLSGQRIAGRPAEADRRQQPVSTKNRTVETVLFFCAQNTP